MCEMEKVFLQRKDKNRIFVKIFNLVEIEAFKKNKNYRICPFDSAGVRRRIGVLLFARVDLQGKYCGRCRASVFVYPHRQQF